MQYFDIPTVNSIDPLTTEDLHCEGCSVAKSKRSAFNHENPHPARRPLHRIHSDVMELETPSLGGKRYIVSFIDEYSRFAFIYCISTKDEVAAKFVDFKTQVETLHRATITELRCDNGGEYINDSLGRQLRSAGTQLRPTQPYSPQQNGLAERYNQTLMNQVRAILHSSGAPKHLWGELVQTVNYLRHRTPSTAIQGKTPYELWYGTKPSIEHLRVLWSDAYMHIPRQRRRGKLAARARKVKLIGYRNSTTYRLYDTDTHEIFESVGNFESLFICLS